ncbi:amino acid ABC transporter permease [Actinomycetota bacterium]
MNQLWQDWLTYDGRLIGGILLNAKIALFTLLIGLPIGLLLAIGSGAVNKVIRWVCIVLVEIGRGTPAILMILLFYYGLPDRGLSLSAFVAAVLALSVTTAAYTAEIIRGGLQAVPDGELEAAHALGMSQFDTLRYIVVPQGIRIAIPPLMGFAILIFQASTLAFTITVPELMAQARSIASQNFRHMNMFVLAAILFAAITIPASWLSERAEKRLSRHL